MSNVQITRVRSRLSTLALGKGGVTAKQAIARADAALEGISGTLIEAVDAILVELEARFGERSPDGSVGDYEGLYGLASGIIDLATCLSGSLIDKAAYALCDLADLSAECKVWDRQAVEVHVMVLKLLRHSGPEMPLARRQRVVEGLYLVTAKRVGDIDAARRGRAG